MSRSQQHVHLKHNNRDNQKKLDSVCEATAQRGAQGLLRTLQLAEREPAKDQCMGNTSKGALVHDAATPVDVIDDEDASEHHGRVLIPLVCQVLAATIDAREEQVRDDVFDNGKRLRARR